jgi:hypothetical protein
VSKLSKGNAAFAEIKRCLGWDYAVKSKTLLVAPHREEKVRSSIAAVIDQRRVGRSTWESLVGQLRSLVPGIPGSEGQFSLLQAALPGTGIRRSGAGIGSCQTVVAHLYLDLLDNPQPTLFEELVPGHPTHIGACDAAKSGAGGVWFPYASQTNQSDYDGEPLVWRLPFPEEVQNEMVSWNNPRGRITNSEDMETAGTILHQDVLGDHALVAGETCHNYSDNTPSVTWRTKGSATTTKATAALLRYTALHRRRHQSRNQYQHLSGDENYMGDDASRLWNLSDSEFLT